MIGCIVDPDDDARLLFVPLVRVADDVWVPIRASQRGHADIMDAARACADGFADEYRAIETQARVVRALCEHREFEFDADALDSRMVRAEVLQLEAMISGQARIVDRLLDGVDANDDIRVDGRRMEVCNNGRLRPMSTVPLVIGLARHIVEGGYRQPGVVLSTLVRSLVEGLPTEFGHALAPTDLDTSIELLQKARKRAQPTEAKPGSDGDVIELPLPPPLEPEPADAVPTPIDDEVPGSEPGDPP